MKKLFNFIAILALFSANLTAQDKITFTWYADNYPEGHQSVRIKVTDGNLFLVNWGDETNGIETGNGNAIIGLTHTYLALGEYSVTITALNSSCRFTYFDCTHVYSELNNHIKTLILENCSNLLELNCNKNELKNIDLTDCKALNILDCEDNQLTSLDLSICPYLTHLDCSWNQIGILDVSKCLSIIDLHCSYNKIKNLDLVNYSFLSYLNCQFNELQSLDLSNCSSLLELGCIRNNIENLNLTGCSKLETMYCYRNNLKKLDLTDCSNLSSLYCIENQLQLSDLFAAQFVPEKYLGIQYLPAKTAVVGAELFADQSVFNGIFTEYIVLKEDGGSVSESDYTVIDGKITVYTKGHYTITMSNDAIISAPNYPAKVVVEIYVYDVGILENNLLNINVYPNPTDGKLVINSGELMIVDVEIFDINGRRQKAESRRQKAESRIVIDISYLPAGIYFIKATTDKGDIVKKIVKQ